MGFLFLLQFLFVQGLLEDRLVLGAEPSPHRHGGEAGPLGAEVGF